MVCCLSSDALQALILAAGHTWGLPTGLLHALSFDADAWAAVWQELEGELCHPQCCLCFQP